MPRSQTISAENGMHPQFLTNAKNKFVSYIKHCTSVSLLLIFFAFIMESSIISSHLGKIIYAFQIYMYSA